MQYSSYDRRSTTPDAPDWFSNSDGFGREPIPGFAGVLREADSSGVGLYLVTDVAGPGAIVRGWSAGMGGTWRVYLDGSETPIWEDSAYEFLARRSVHYFEQAGIDFETGDAFVQQDADYLPMLFAKRLRVTWDGRIDRLHFYHLQVLLYDPDARLRTFDPKQDLRESRDLIAKTIAGLTDPQAPEEGEAVDVTAEIAPRGEWTWERATSGAGEAITHFAVRVKADDVHADLRGTLLRIWFDGAGRPQVVNEERVAAIVIGGLNPMATLVETGVNVSLKAMDGLVEYETLFHYEELEDRLARIG